MNVLVTGGTGYIGSHTVVELLEKKHKVIIIDDFSNSKPEVLSRIKMITGQKPVFYEGSVQDGTLLSQVFKTSHVEAVIHFAGFKSVGVSVKEPLPYYQNNIVSCLTLLEVMRQARVKKIIFSSSAAVYGKPAELPLSETSRTGSGITNPYGRTKYMVEQILSDMAASDPSWEITALRYFNPVGAHDSGLIGEDPQGIPDNLLPYICRVAGGKSAKLKVFGNDYDTPDGSGIRDYIHVVDLAKGHIKALDDLKPRGQTMVYNLGTGRGTSVFDMIQAFQKASGKEIPYEVVGRRAGDVATCYASVKKANEKLGWRTEKDLEEACADSWRWQSQNPKGYV